MICYGRDNTRYELEEPPFNDRGGEGNIYRIRGRRGILAKIYVDADRGRTVMPATPRLKKKLEAMAKHQRTVRPVLSNVSWALEVLYDANKQCIGYVMPELSFDADLLPQGKILRPDDSRYTGQTTNRLKIHIGKNLCKTISRVHQCNCIFGDFNPKNVGVDSRTGDVFFLDTDTYQLTYRGYEDCRCLVGFPGYVAPELLEKCDRFKRHNPGRNAYSEMPGTFTKETDYFALGIYIFQLLMNGEHPYNGIKIIPGRSFASPGAGDAPIMQDFYVFKQGISQRPGSKIISLTSFPQEMGELFARTFTNKPQIRPTADEWFRSLTRYENSLNQCRQDSRHQYWSGNRACPYCEDDQRQGAGNIGFTSSVSFAGKTNFTGLSSSPYTGTRAGTPSPRSQSQSVFSAIKEAAQRRGTLSIMAIVLGIMIGLLAISALALLPADIGNDQGIIRTVVVVITLIGASIGYLSRQENGTAGGCCLGCLLSPVIFGVFVAMVANFSSYQGVFYVSGAIIGALAGWMLSKKIPKRKLLHASLTIALLYPVAIYGIVSTSHMTQQKESERTIPPIPNLPSQESQSMFAPPHQKPPQTADSPDQGQRRRRSLPEDSETTAGSAPLNFLQALQKETLQDVRIIVEKNMDFDTNDSFGDTLLHKVAFNPNVDVLEYVVSKGADVNAKNNFGVTPLHQAALGNSNAEVLKYLISKGADVNAKTQFGGTPLHHAAGHNSRVQILECLVFHGADVNAKNNDGKTPSDIADTEEKRRILREVGRRIDLPQKTETPTPAQIERQVDGDLGKLREWKATTSKGNKYSHKAFYVKSDDKTVTLKREDGKVVTVDLSLLSQDDRDYVKHRQNTQSSIVLPPGRRGTTKIPPPSPASPFPNLLNKPP